MRYSIFIRTLLIIGGLLIGFAASPVYAANYSTWTPYAGQSDVNRDYSYNRMIWNNTSGFGANSTYEHETLIYNFGFAKPDASGYWSSNLPYAYKDVRCCFDSADQFAIGSSFAYRIVLQQWYYTYYDLQIENSSVYSSTVRINGQLGHRYPSWCYSNGWCVYADETYGLTQFTAPAGLSWFRR